MKLIVGIDPGKTNLAFVIMTEKGKIKYKGLITQTYSSLATSSVGKGKNKIITPADVHVKLGIAVIKKMVNFINRKSKGKEVHLVYERFVPRGRFNRGNLTEIINMIIGQFISSIAYSKVTPLMAATWKRRAKEKYGYEENLNKTLPQHIIDAYCIGLYYLENNKDITPERAKYLVQRIEEKDYGWTNSKKSGWVKPSKTL